MKSSVTAKQFTTFNSQPWAHSIGATLVAEVDPLLPAWGLFDRTRIQQALANFASNSLVGV
jgi:hypothetical protein